MLKKIAFVCFAGAMAAVLCATYVSTRVYSWHGNHIRNVDIEGARFHAEVVDTPDKLAKGLGGRSGLCGSCAMMFVFPEQKRHGFWMKDMRFPLDIIWIADGRIIHMEYGISPSSREVYSPALPSDSVLEVRAGTAEKLGWDIGANVVW